MEGVFDLRNKAGVKLGDEVLPLPSFFHVVKFLFHLGGELEVHNIGEVLDDGVANGFSEFGGFEVFALLFGISALGDDADNGSVGARSADAVFFQRLDQRCFRITGRRLCEVLVAVEGFQLQRIALGQRRQLLVVLIVLGAVLCFLVKSGKAVELDAVAVLSSGFSL